MRIVVSDHAKRGLEKEASRTGKLNICSNIHLTSRNHLMKEELLLEKLKIGK